MAKQVKKFFFNLCFKKPFIIKMNKFPSFIARHLILISSWRKLEHKNLHSIKPRLHIRKYLMNRLLQDRVHYICNQSTFYCILKSSSIVCSYLLIASTQILWYFVIVNHTCFLNTRYVVFEELITVIATAHIWIIGGHTDLRT